MKKLIVLGLILTLLLIAGPVSALNLTVANFSANVTSGAAPLAVGFTDLSVNATGWVWYFGDESYNNSWQQMNASDGFTAAFHNSAVALPDGSIVYCPAWNLRNETYRSTDDGASWQLVNGSGGWEARGETYNSMAVLTDGTIVKMGGSDGNTIFYNDTWKSTDKGSTWELVNSSSGWSPRANTVAVALSDDSVVIMGGNYGPNNDNLLNDVWRSTDQGFTWTQINESAGWSPRRVHAAVPFSDGSIVLMGGFAGNNRNDTWLSQDKGYTWAQVNASSGWSARRAMNAAAMPDGSIVLVGGITSNSTGGDIFLNDVWRSTDRGSTWTQVNSNAFPPRAGPSIAVTSDGSLVVMDGLYIDSTQSPNDVWRLRAEGSTAQNSSHTYTAPGTYQVSLQVRNADGYNTTRKTGFITVSAPIAPVASFTTNVTSGTAPLSVQFNDTSSNVPTAWNWSFTNITPGNNTQVWFSQVRNPVQTFGGGNFSIVLNASNSAGNSISTQVTFINVTAATGAPVASFTTNVTSGTAPLSVQFNDTSSNVPTAWNWSFTNITPGNNTQVWFSQVQNPVQTFGVGNFSIVLNASNIAGNSISTQVTFINVTNQSASIGVWRGGVFYLRNSPTVTTSVVYGLPTDTPLIGDWNGTGTDTAGVWRGGVFYLRNSPTVTTSVVYGLPTDTPFIWTDNGTSKVGVFRNGVFYLRNSPTVTTSVVYGLPTDTPLIGDWNGTGTDTAGVWRGGAFYLRNSPTVTTSVVYGLPTDTPIVGKWG